MGLSQSRRRVVPRLLMVGLDAAGKSTILRRLNLGQVIAYTPTIGFNVELLDGKKVSLTAWDVGGSDKIRPLLRHYYGQMDGVIFVVDSNDRERLLDAQRVLSDMLREEDLKDKPFLFFVNKQDLPTAMSANDIVHKLRLDYMRRRSWFVQGACATTGEGLQEGLDWMLSVLQQGAKCNLSSPHVPVQVGSTFVVAAESIKVWTGALPPPPSFSIGDSLRSNNIEMRLKGASLTVAEIADLREVLMGVFCRTEEPDEVWFEYAPGQVRPPADFLVTLQHMAKEDGGSALLCYNLSGSEIANFDVLDEKCQTLADLTLLVSQQLEHVSCMQLKFVLEDGRVLDGFPGKDPLADVLQGLSRKYVEGCSS